MKTSKVTKVLGLIGALLWSGTIFLREVGVNEMGVLNFVLGIMPNIGAAWFFAWMIEKMYTNLKKRNISFKEGHLVALAILILGLISEIIHALFLNSSFDLNDICATCIALIIFLVPYYIGSKHKSLKSL